MHRTSKIFHFLIIVVLLLLQLLFLFLIKYQNQELAFSEFSLKKIGNIFNVLIYSGLILGIYIVQKKLKSEKKNKNIYTFIIVSWLLLIISFISTKVKVFSQNVYFFNQQGDKVLTGILFLLFLFVILYFLIFIWNKILVKGKNSIVRDLFSTVLMMILFLLLTFIYVGERDDTYSEKVLSKNENNIAIVLGAAVWSGNIPSPTLSSRVDKALSLLENRYVGKIVLTGGNAPGEMSESEVAYEYAKVKGVDTSKIIIERKTSSTTDQIKWIKKNLMLNNKTNVEIILVSDGYHLPRAIEISKFFNLYVKAAKSIHELSFRDKIFTKIRESIALILFWNFAL